MPTTTVRPESFMTKDRRTKGAPVVFLAVDHTDCVAEVTAVSP